MADAETDPVTVRRLISRELKYTVLRLLTGLVPIVGVSQSIDRRDFGVGWQGAPANNSVVVGKRVFITIAAEATLDDA